MREIKFRAWSNKFKRMFRVSEVYMTRDGYVHGTVDAGFSNEYFQYLTDEERKSPLNYIGRVDFVKSNDGRTAGLFQDPTDEPFYLIQYTGLKDKNGKEIYEGDIVKYSFKDGEHINTRFMQIYNDGVNFKMKELYRNYWLEKVDGVLKIKHGHLTKYKGDVNLLCDVSTILYWYEVIGNIYENPELLEEN